MATTEVAGRQVNGLDVDALAGVIRDGDVVLTMGAGHIGAVANDLPRALPASIPPGAISAHG